MTLNVCQIRTFETHSKRIKEMSDTKLYYTILYDKESWVELKKHKLPKRSCL